MSDETRRDRSRMEPKTDNRPIGFFDSGLGGLTCIPYLTQALPEERVVYFGDTARTPYGSKSPETIRAFSTEIVNFLVKNNVKMIVIACNTVSATCLNDLRETCPTIPVLGIISPAARAVANTCTPENHIGVIGTKATIRSGAYRRKILSINAALDIAETPCPVLAPLIEEGIIQNEIMDLSIRHYLDQFISYNNIDTLVLGCTHYPLIRKNLQKLYPHLRIIDPSEEILESIKAVMAENGIYAGKAEREHIFYASDLSENFINMINRILKGVDFTVTFKNFGFGGKKSNCSEVYQD